MRTSVSWRWSTVACLALVGCAGLDVDPVPDATADAAVEGVRYYEASPYVLVHTDNAGGLVSKLIYLPDLTRKMSADPYAYLASNKTTLQFANGVLTTATDEGDGTAVPKAVISMLEKAAKAAAAAAFNAPPGERRVPAPSLFKVVHDPAGWRLIGGSSDATINVTVPQ